MLSTSVAVKSRLKLLIAERNIERLKRGEAPLGVRAIAEAAGMPVSVVSGLSSGRAQRVDFRTLDRLCRALNCTPGDILEYTPDTQ